MFGEQLEHGHARAHELEHVVALQLASCGHGAEYGADVGQRASADLRGVGHGLEHVGHLLAAGDAGGGQARGHGGGVAQAERGALDRGERVVHDFGDAGAVVAEAFEFGLRVLDVEGAFESAFGGECGDASGDGAYGAEAEFADFAECAAKFGQDAVAAFFAGVFDGGVEVSFEFFAEVLAGW